MMRISTNFGLLIQKTVTFYTENFIKVSYDKFYKSDHLDIEKINIVEIAKALKFQNGKKKSF